MGLRTMLEIELQNNEPKATKQGIVHQMKTLQCCRVDFSDKMWTGLYIMIVVYVLGTQGTGTGGALIFFHTIFFLHFFLPSKHLIWKLV